MASKSRSGATNKKRAAARAKAHDRRLLTQAEREDAEGKVARDYLNRLTAALEKAAPKPMPLGEVAAQSAEPTVPRTGTDDPTYVREQLAKACDQLAIALTTADQRDDHEMVDTILPAMTTLWSTRMELDSVGGAQ